MASLVLHHSLIKTALLYYSFCLYFNYNYGATIEPNEVKSYLAKVNSTLWNIVKNYGLSNLPVPNYQLQYNVDDGFGYKLVGSLFLEEGFVFDFSKFLVDERKVRTSQTPPNFTIQGEIEIKTMQIFQDFRFEFKNPVNYSDKANGSVITEPNLFSFLFKVNKVYPNEEVDAIVESLSDIKPALKFYPDNGLSQRLRKMYQKEAGKQVKFVLDDIRKEWKPIFDKLLNEAVKQVKFPKVNF